MTPAQWDEVIALFDAAVDRSPDDQDALLADVTSPIVRDAARRLLIADREAPSFLERNAFEVLALGESTDDAPDATEAMRGGDGAGTEVERRRIGAYRLIRTLGRGGMGTVYLAERADGAYQQRVALKQVRGGLDGSELAARLRRERQILAGLQHENVARLLDGGVDDDGRPFLVMEYVEGERIDAYCDARGLGVGERLALFRQVAAAVASAHRRTVIHRDLKPSNVLVCDDPDGGAPVVKLLDFGIAKLLSPEATANGTPFDDATDPLTRTGARMMTPEYAAPEQIAGEDVTTATDVYQLGTLLYELLTGRRPFDDVTSDVRGHARLRAVEDAVLDGTPQRPSGAATQLSTEATHRTRGVDPETLWRTLRGDLDAIVLKALRREPDARYASVDALLADLTRYVEGRPVEARRGSRSYRLRKWLSRHWIMMTVATAFVGLLTAWALTATQQTHEVQRALDQARSEATEKEEVINFLVSILDIADPNENQQYTLTVEEFVDRGRRLMTELHDRPALRGRIALELARLYGGLGDYDAMQAMADTSVTLRRRADVDVPPPDLAESIRYAALARVKNSNPAEAGSLYAAGLSIWERLPVEIPLDERRVDFASDYADWLRNAERTADAERVLGSVLDRWTDGPATEALAKATQNLALVRRNQERYAEADSLYRKTLSMYEELDAGPTTAKANTLNNLGVLLHQIDRHDEAIRYLEQSLQTWKKLIGADHPDLAASLYNLGQLYLEVGDPSKAEERLREALRVLVQSVGERHFNTATVRQGLGDVLLQTGRQAEGIDHLRRGLETKQSILGEAHSDVIESRILLASRLRDAQRYSEAAREYERSIRQCRTNQPELKEELASALVGSAKLLIRRGQFAQAVDRAEEATALRRDLYESDDDRVVRAQAVLDQARANAVPS